MVPFSPGCIIDSMNPATNSSSGIVRLKQEARNFFAGIRPVWPFFALLTLAMIVLYVLTVLNAPVMHNPLVLVLFTFLMLAHTILHWLSPYAAANTRLSIFYLLIQLTLLVGIIVLCRYETVTMGLFMGLVGEMLGVVRPLKRSLIAVLGLSAVVFVLHGLLFGWTTSGLFFLTIVPLTFFVVIYVYLFTNQLEEKKHVEDLLKELEAAHRQLSEYASRIEDLTLANERQRMARELHDTLSQGLAGVILQLEAASQHLENGNNEKARAILKQAGSHARSTLAEARQVIDDLRNATPVPLDLQDFIREKADQFTSLSGLPCEVDLQTPLTLTGQLSAQIEKIVSEALTNVLRHSQARRCWVNLHAEAHSLHLEIGDDGCGFDTGILNQSGGHYGLIGIRERVRLNDGSFAVESAPGQGTRLLITFPIPADGAQAA